MKIELNQKEKKELTTLSKDFVRIHGEIMMVEKKIKELNEKSSSLLKDLDVCRDKEIKFAKKLMAKYGEGSLDFYGRDWLVKEK